jgi:uncharacterized repeat protein (TIGR02543 family)
VGSYNAAAGQYNQTTPVNNTPTFTWQDCYQGGAGYSTSGCEHFGQSMRPVQPGQTVTVTGRWLVDNPQSPGTLIASNPPAAIPFATWFISVPTTFAAPPTVVAQVEAPEPPETPETYGDAQWVKTFVTQLPRAVAGNELTSDNPSVVPEAPTQVEVAWDILQASPPTVNGNQNRTRSRNSGTIKPDTGSVIRRFELYKYTGVYDPISHKVVCADTTCTAPSAGELGGPLSAQNTATNVTADSMSVVETGNGSITDSTNHLSCGKACAMFATNGSVLSLKASTASGAVFAGWTGACSGTDPSCSVTVNGQMTAAATFKSQFTLSIGRSNPGTVTGTPAGNDRAIDCGSNCSAKFTDGTAVTLTAVPPAGKTFANWAGACSGTAPTCTVAISKDTSVQAVFNK